MQPLLLLGAEPEDVAQHLGLGLGLCLCLCLCLCRRGRHLAQIQSRGPFPGPAHCKPLATWVQIIFSVAASRFMNAPCEGRGNR